jgi:conjugal transfer pilus assembly protein TraB
MIQNLKTKWTGMPASKKRTTIIALAVLVFVAALVATSGKDNFKAIKPVDKTDLVSAPKRQITNEDMLAAIDASNRNVSAIKIELDRLKTAPVVPAMTPEQIKAAIDEGAAKAASAASAAAAAAATTSTTPAAPIPAPSVATPLASSDGVPLTPAQTTITKATGFNYLVAPTQNTSNPNAVAATNASANGSGTDISSKKAGSSTGKGANINSVKSYLPPGANIPYVMITGLNAPTTQAALKNPMPALVRVTGDVILPNGYTLDLKDCVINLSGFGQMADERAMMRTEQISCVRTDGKAVDAKMEGYATGEDGKPGIRGRLVSKTGEVVAQMIKIGVLTTGGNVATSLATAFASTNGVKIGNTTVVLGDSGSASLKDATKQATTGFNTIMEKVAGVYEQYAKDTFPVVEVSAGREGNIILTKGLSLDF